MEGGNSAANVKAIAMHLPVKRKMVELLPDDPARQVYRKRIAVLLGYEDIEQCFGMTCIDAAKSLRVSIPTLKRLCRVMGIPMWPYTKRMMFQPSIFNRGSEFMSSNQTPMDCFSTVGETIPNVTLKQDDGSLIVKATYGEDLIRFQLTLSSKMADLIEKVTLRLPLKEGTFKMKYEDNDGDMVLIACDEDLKDCIRIYEGKSTIKMLITANPGI